MTRLLRWTLKQLARITAWRYRPGVVGVTGSVGKTSTKLAIAAALGVLRRVRVSHGNLNNDLGLPLTVLGDWRESDLRLISRDTPAGTKRIRKLLFWCKVVLASCVGIVFKKLSYPEILVLEYGADHPGDLKYLLDIVRPNVSVITAVGDVPVHVEFYSGPDEVAREKSRLIEILPTAGCAVLNHDDESVMNLRIRTRAQIMTFGFGEGADMRISAFEHRVVGERPEGVVFKLEHGGNTVPVRVEGALGKVQALASAAAASVGLIFGMNLVTISEALGSYRPASGRMEILPGIKSIWILNDSYNASPLSMHAALDTLKDLPAKRKVAVLGDMLEIGQYAMEAHDRVGRLAAQAADVLVTVGSRSKFIAGGAREAGFHGEITSVDTAEEAAKAVEETIRKGDLVLVKASHAMQLEKVVETLKIGAIV